MSVKLTQYSHGQGCGCKISPQVLDKILAQSGVDFKDENLLVGNDKRDDAAVYDIGGGEGIISTTDFFMPIVDDAHTFGRIASANAISDVYAMGGMPMMAIAIFGWPIDKLSPEVGRAVISGARATCREAGISLAGGHSIDSPEPIFGLAVTGRVKIKHLKENSKAQVGDKIYLTKPLGVGIYTTAQKQKKISSEDEALVIRTMCQLNDIGSKLALIDGVNAMTDVTGFGLGGHLLEVCQGSSVGAKIIFDALPILPNAGKYLAKGCSPGGALRNFESYGHHLSPMSIQAQPLICDPQTSGGLLIMVASSAESEVVNILGDCGFDTCPIGTIVNKKTNQHWINIDA
jgi:selenide,water dikinase